MKLSADNNVNFMFLFGESLFFEKCWVYTPFWTSSPDSSDFSRLNLFILVQSLVQKD